MFKKVQRMLELKESAFSRQHYEAVAKILKETIINDALRYTVCERFVALFAADNPNFNASRFHQAANT